MHGRCGWRDLCGGRIAKGPLQFLVQKFQIHGLAKDVVTPAAKPFAMGSGDVSAVRMMTGMSANGGTSRILVTMEIPCISGILNLISVGHEGIEASLARGLQSFESIGSAHHVVEWRKSACEREARGVIVLHEKNAPSGLVGGIRIGRGRMGCFGTCFRQAAGGGGESRRFFDSLFAQIGLDVRAVSTAFRGQAPKP